MKRKKNKYMILLVLLLAISLGYAAISTTLKITGIANIHKHSWRVYWTNPQVTEGSVTNTPPDITEEDGDPEDTEVVWDITLNLPGDFYEFTVDAVNEGSVDAMIQNITPTVSPALPDYISYTLTYDDGDPVEQNQMLPKAVDSNTPTVETFKVRIEFLNTITLEELEAVPDGGINFSFSFSPSFAQANSSAIRRVPGAHCPGSKCVYAFYNGYPGNEYGDYSIDVGDVLPLEIGTTSTHNATANYFGGATSNYKNLKLEYTEYMNSPSWGHLYYNSLEECRSLTTYANTCAAFRTPSFQPTIFFGHYLDSNRIVLEKYACIDYNNQVYCFNNYKEYESRKARAEAAYEVFAPVFGEYDSTTDTGCRIYNASNSSFICKSPDGSMTVEFYAGTSMTPNGLLITEREDSTSIYIALDDDVLTGPTYYPSSGD